MGSKIFESDLIISCSSGFSDQATSWFWSSFLDIDSLQNSLGSLYLDCIDRIVQPSEYKHVDGFERVLSNNSSQISYPAFGILNSACWRRCNSSNGLPSILWLWTYEFDRVQIEPYTVGSSSRTVWWLESLFGKMQLVLKDFEVRTLSALRLLVGLGGGEWRWF